MYTCIESISFETLQNLGEQDWHDDIETLLADVGDDATVVWDDTSTYLPHYGIAAVGAVRHCGREDWLVTCDGE